MLQRNQMRLHVSSPIADTAPTSRSTMAAAAPGKCSSSSVCTSTFSRNQCLLKQAGESSGARKSCPRDHYRKPCPTRGPTIISCTQHWNSCESAFLVEDNIKVIYESRPTSIAERQPSQSASSITPVESSPYMKSEAKMRWGRRWTLWI